MDSNTFLTIALISTTILGWGLAIYFLLKPRTNDVVHKVQPTQPKLQTIKALVLDNVVNLMGDKVIPYTVPHILATTIEFVYIKYYDYYKRMKVLMYDEEVGWVLIPEEGDNEPKFYYPHKVHIGLPNKDFVEGYIRREDGEEVFVVVGLTDAIS